MKELTEAKMIQKGKNMEFRQGHWLIGARAEATY